MVVLEWIISIVMASLVIREIAIFRYHNKIENTRPEKAYNKKDFLLLARIVRSWKDPYYLTASVLNLNEVSDIKAYIEQINSYMKVAGIRWTNLPSPEVIEKLERLRSQGAAIHIMVNGSIPYRINVRRYTEEELQEFFEKLQEHNLE